MTIDRNPGFVAGTIAILLGTVAGILTAAVQPGAPLEGAFWVAPLVFGITTFATLLKATFNVEDAG